MDGPTCQHGGKCMDRVNGTECDCLGTGYKVFDFNLILKLISLGHPLRPRHWWVRGGQCELRERELLEFAGHLSMRMQNRYFKYIPNFYLNFKLLFFHLIFIYFSGYIGQRCHMVNPCVPDPLTNNSAAHNCAHGLCVRPRVMMGAGGREVFYC